MRVEGWLIHLPDYVHDAMTDLSILSEDKIKDIAFNYAQQHFPHFKEFPNWEITFVEKNLLKNKNKVGQVIKEAWIYLFSLIHILLIVLDRKYPSCQHTAS